MTDYRTCRPGIGKFIRERLIHKYYFTKLLRISFFFATLHNAFIRSLKRMPLKDPEV